FKNGKNKDFSKVTQAKSDLENSVKDAIIDQKITDKVDNLNQAVSVAKIAGDFSGVEQALADLKNFSKEQLAQQAQKNESFNVGKSEIYQSVKNGVNGTLVGNGLSGTEATALAKNFSDIKKELNEKFKNFNNNNNGLKNGTEPIYAQVNKKKTGQVASPEEPIYAQVAKKVTQKIDQLNQAASGFGGVGQAGFPLKRHDKVDDLSKVGRSVSPEPIYATIDDLGGPFPLKKHAKVEDLSKAGLSRNQELTQKIDNLSQAVSEAKAGFFGNLEQTIDKLKDFTKNNPVNLWAEGAKKVPASLSAKLDNYATNSHTRINSNIQNGAINEKATGMLTQKNPEWLKLVNDKIVAHNVGSAPLSEYDNIGFSQKNMKDYSDSFKFSTKLNNAVKDIKSGFTQFLANAFSTGYYSMARENAEHGIKNANTKGGFQKS
ncbi:cytotoxicity-associated immunodominant antigen domain protein, partial [Helicobacter pylori GAM270ASi]